MPLKKKILLYAKSAKKTETPASATILNDSTQSDMQVKSTENNETFADTKQNQKMV